MLIVQFEECFYLKYTTEWLISYRGPIGNRHFSVFSKLSFRLKSLNFKALAYNVHRIYGCFMVAFVHFTFRVKRLRVVFHQWLIQYTRWNIIAPTIIMFGAITFHRARQRSESKKFNIRTQTKLNCRTQGK